MAMDVGSQNSSNLLQVESLITSFKSSRGSLRAVDDISFTLGRGRALGLVGESGCGKTVTALSLMRLLADHASITAKKIVFDNHDLLRLDSAQMRRIRGNEMSMIFQEPMTSLNPVFSIGDQLAEVFRLHRGMRGAAALDAAAAILEQVKIPSAKRRLADYPHHLSGGMRQRVMIAMALACKPKLLIADEPTTALDVTIQAQILELIDELRRKLQMSMIMVTHDLGVVSEVCEDVVVMYAGQVAEQGSVADIFADPKHPYTVGLLACIPKLGKKVKRLATIPGFVPPLTARFQGCQFQNRCPRAIERCKSERPILTQIQAQHYAACWNPH